MKKIKLVISAVKQMGLPWVVYRTTYEIRKKLGFFTKKFPVREFSDAKFLQTIGANSKAECLKMWHESKAGFLPVFSHLPQLSKYLQETLSPQDKAMICEIADRAIQGQIFAFSHWYADFGFPIDWQYNPVTKKHGKVDCHWSKINDLDQSFGDIKFVWEASRFPQVYYFVRAYLLTGDEKYVEAFFQQCEAWIQANPVELGLNWKCGQELTIRMMAWIFGLYAFQEKKSATDERIFTLLKNIYYHAWHIDQHFEFALYAVKNNHTISEACGIFTAGVLFPFMDKNGHWLKKGRKYLEKEGLCQIYSDGSYLQHSMNYQRLVVQMYSWAFALAEANNISFGQELKDRVAKCVEFLYQVQGDGKRVPNYGSNDGALVFPLSVEDYLNYAPALNALYALLNHQRLYPAGKHDEELIWFNGFKGLNYPEAGLGRTPKAYPIGGYYLLRSENSYGFTRCCRYIDRPAQADMLHLDLWWKGENILRDAGSFSYNPGSEFANVFNGSVAHNTLVINGLDQMQKSSRFMWQDWTVAKILHFNAKKGQGVFRGEHYGYTPVVHRRSIHQFGDLWVVVDDLLNLYNQVFIEQYWHLGGYQIVSANGRFVLKTPVGDFTVQSVQVADEADFTITKSWHSLYYGKKQEWPCLYRNIKTDQTTRLITIFYPEGCVDSAHYDRDSLTINAGDNLVINLGNIV